jgi:hypothetical protein
MKILEGLYAATVFLSAFLLFQIQPIIAKMLIVPPSTCFCMMQ